MTQLRSFLWVPSLFWTRNCDTNMSFTCVSSLWTSKLLGIGITSLFVPSVQGSQRKMPTEAKQVRQVKDLSWVEWKTMPWVKGTHCSAPADYGYVERRPGLTNLLLKRKQKFNLLMWILLILLHMLCGAKTKTKTHTHLKCNVHHTQQMPQTQQMLKTHLLNKSHAVSGMAWAPTCWLFCEVSGMALSQENLLRFIVLWKDPSRDTQFSQFLMWAALASPFTPCSHGCGRGACAPQKGFRSGQTHNMVPWICYRTLRVF